VRKIVYVSLCIMLGYVFILLPLKAAQPQKSKIILLISEQNISGPQHAWWASEIDLSATEQTIAKKLIEEGYEVLEPSMLSKSVLKNKAFRLLNLSEGQAVKLGNLSKADFVVAGKAVASSGGHVPDSNMRSCFGNITAKLIDTKSAKVIAYLDAAGTCVHLDLITGGKEALVSASADLAAKIIEVLKKEGGK